MKNIFYSLFILAALSTRAQVMSYDFYSFKINNMFNVNPAYTGKDDGLNVVLSAQTQNKGVPYANKNYMAGTHGKISKKQALGLKLISDSRGAFRVLKADLTYAYIAKISDDAKLSLGLSGGLLNNSLLLSRIDNYDLLDQSDPTLTNPYNNSTQFAAGAGLLFNYKGLDLSFSMPHMVTTGQPISSYINTAVFYTIEAGDEFKITPWLCYQNVSVTKDITSLFLKTMYKDAIWIQAGYQTNKSFCAMLGFNMETLSIGYGYKTSNQEFNAVSSGQHEITLVLRLKGPGIFRHL